MSSGDLDQHAFSAGMSHSVSNPVFASPNAKNIASSIVRSSVAANGNTKPPEIATEPSSTVTVTPPVSTNNSSSGSSASTQPLTLLQAVINGDVRKVRKMVVKGVSADEANQKDAQGRTALCIACANGMVLSVEFLSFLPEIDPNKSDKEGNTPLLLAAQAGHVDCIRILLKEFRNVKLDHQNRNGYTALIQAAINGRTDCAKTLLESGANPFFADRVRKKNALQWAEYCGRTPCVAVIKDMSGRFPALVRHLVQAGQSVLTRHRSVWGSDGEIDRIAELERMTAKSRGGGERRGTISKLLQKSAKWIRSLSKKKKPNYRSISALVNVGIAISGPVVNKQILDKKADEEKAVAPKDKRVTARRGSKSKGSSQNWQIPEVTVIAPADEFSGWVSQTVIVSPKQEQPAPPENIVVEPTTPSSTPKRSVKTQPEMPEKVAKTVTNEKWGQNASAPTSPVLSSRSAERAHRRRFAQRAAATTNRHQGHHHTAGPTAFATAYHAEDVLGEAAEHLNAIAAVARGDFADDDDEDDDQANSVAGGLCGEDSSIEEEDELDLTGFQVQQTPSGNNSVSSQHSVCKVDSLNSGGSLNNDSFR